MPCCAALCFLDVSSVRFGALVVGAGPNELGHDVLRRSLYCAVLGFRV